MSEIKPDDKFLINREGVDYKATVDQFAKDINIHVNCGGGGSGGGGGSLDCDGVAACLANAPIDPPEYSFAIRVHKPDVSNWYWPEGTEDFPGQGIFAHLYAQLCDPDTHQILESSSDSLVAGDKTIWRLPGFYAGYDLPLSITSSPVGAREAVYSRKGDSVYGIYPTSVNVKDIKIWRGSYIENSTITEELWTDGSAQGEGTWNKGDGFIHLYPFERVGDYYPKPYTQYEKDNKTFFRIQFTCHNNEQYTIVLITYNYQAQKPEGGVDYRGVITSKPESYNEVKPSEDD